MRFFFFRIFSQFLLFFSEMWDINLPDLMNVRINSRLCQIKTKTLGTDTKNGLWRVYATRWVGLGLWGRCVSYARQQISYRENCILYAYQTRACHIYTKVNFFSYQYHDFSFLFWRAINRHCYLAITFEEGANEIGAKLDILLKYFASKSVRTSNHVLQLQQHHN